MHSILSTYKANVKYPQSALNCFHIYIVLRHPNFVCTDRSHINAFFFTFSAEFLESYTRLDGAFQPPFPHLFTPQRFTPFPDFFKEPRLHFLP